MANSAFYFHANDVKPHVRAEERSDFRERLRHSSHFRPASASDCDGKSVHEGKAVTANSSEFPRALHEIRIRAHGVGSALVGSGNGNHPGRGGEKSELARNLKQAKRLLAPLTQPEDSSTLRP